MNKPLIGITRDFDGTPGPTDSHYAFYSDCVQNAGGEPAHIFFNHEVEEVGEVLDGLDGLLLAGGDDLDPALWGEPWHPKAVPMNPRRQRFELALLAEAERRKLPIFGICLGCQMMNVHRGGSLHQFLPDLPRPEMLEHRKFGGLLPRHEVRIDTDSILFSAIGKPVVMANSNHKQAVNRVGGGLRPVAWSPDGVIEGIEDPSGPLFLGVQWHPERLGGEPDHAALFGWLVSAAMKHRRPVPADI